MKNLLALFILGFCHHSICAQDSFQMESYLATALTDQSLERYQSQLNFLDNNNYNAPWLSRVELRVGSENATIKPNQYRVRLSPTTPSEIIANKRYYEQHINVINTQHKIAVVDALMNRYRLIIKLANLLDRKKLLQERIDFQKQFIENIGMERDQSLELKDIISIQADQSKYLLKQEEIETLIAHTLHFIQFDYGDASNDYDSIINLITIDEIKRHINGISVQKEMYNLEAEAIKNELELSRRDLKIEKAESRSNMGYIQGNYDSQKGNELNEHIGFQVGLRIPIVNSKKPSLNRQKIQLIEEERKTESRLSLLNQNQKLNDLLFMRLLSRYQLILDRIKIAEGIPKSNPNHLDWSQILDLKNYQLQLFEEKVETEKTIREAYIGSLNDRGVLIGTPVINYLSKNFSVIKR